MAALDVETALSNVKAMLAALTAWQTICGVSSSTEAATRIHYGAIEDNQESSPISCIILDVSSLTTRWQGNKLHGSLVIELRFSLEMPDSEKATFSDQYIWVWGKFGAMLAGIETAVGGAGQGMIESLDVPLLPGRIDPDENKGVSEWNFILSLGLDFI